MVLKSLGDEGGRYFIQVCPKNAVGRNMAHLVEKGVT